MGMATPLSAVFQPALTTLPSGPVDGQECFYLADATAGIVWHLRYRAGSASAYKWEWVGGSELSAAVTTEELVASINTFQDLATVLGITVPLAGDYVVTTGGTIHNQHSTTDAGGNVGVGVGTGVGGADTRPYVGVSLKPFFQAMGLVLVDVTGVAAAASIRAKYAGGTTSVAHLGRWLRLRPSRVG